MLYDASRSARSPRVSSVAVATATTGTGPAVLATVNAKRVAAHRAVVIVRYGRIRYIINYYKRNNAINVIIVSVIIST